MDSAPKTTIERLNELLGNHNWRYSDITNATASCNSDKPYATWQKSYLTSGAYNPICMSTEEWNSLHLRGVISALAIPVGIVSGILLNKNRSLERKLTGAVIGSALGCLVWFKVYPASV